MLIDVPVFPRCIITFHTKYTRKMTNDIKRTSNERSKTQGYKHIYFLSKSECLSGAFYFYFQDLTPIRFKTTPGESTRPAVVKNS